MEEYFSGRKNVSYLNGIWQRAQEVALRPQSFLLLYLLSIVLSESVTLLVAPQVGLAFHGLLLLILIVDAALASHEGMSDLLLVLTFAPLIRLLSLSMPLNNLPLLYWYPVIGVPLFVAALLTTRVTKMNRRALGLNGNAIFTQIMIGLSGIGLGYVEYLILQPDPIVSSLHWRQLLLPALILIVFTGFLEELIFRGLMQSAAVRVLGRWGIIYVSTLYAAMHLGHGSALGVLFVFTVAVFFGLVTLRTGSILGVSLAHGLTNVTLYLIFPFVLATTSA